MEKPLKVKYPYRYVDTQSPYPENRGMFVILKVYSREHWTQLLSAGLEGAYLLYPDDTQHVTVPFMESQVMNCDEIASCLLSNEDFMSSLENYLLSSTSFIGGISGGVTQNAIDGNTQLSTSDQVKDLEESSEFRDAIWGGCVEVVEYWLDLLKTLCFILRAFGDIQDLVTQLYSKDKNKRYEFEARDLENNPHSVGDDGEIVTGDGGEWEFVPNFLGQLVYGIAESTMLSWLSGIASLGADLILADITDTRAEYIACVLFNEICCFDGNVKEPPYKFETTTVFNTGVSLASTPLDSGLAGLALSACLAITGVVSEFVTAFPLDETHRNFRIGMRSPNDEWVEICDSCNEPPETWEQTFLFDTSPHSEFWTYSEEIFSPNSIIENTKWESSFGWGDGRIYDGARQRDYAVIEAYFDSVITGVDVTYQGIAGVGGSFFANNYAVRKIVGTTYTNIVSISPSMTMAGIFSKENEVSPTSVNGIQIAISGYQRAGNNNPQGQTWIRSVTIRGIGENPFV